MLSIIYNNNIKVAYLYDGSSIILYIRIMFCLHLWRQTDLYPLLYQVSS